MLPIPPPSEQVARHAQSRIINFHSPEGVPEEECGTVSALTGRIQGGIFDGGPAVRTYWKPDAEEIEALLDGGYIELTFFDGTMPMTALAVHRKS